MKDYCTMFPEYWRGIYIGDCCKLHDSTLSTSSFYKCLRGKVDIISASIITLGGSVGCWIKCPIQMLKRI